MLDPPALDALVDAKVADGAVADVVEETVEAAGCCLVGWAVSGQTYNGSFSKLTIIMSKADDVADICRKG